MDLETNHAARVAGWWNEKTRRERGSGSSRLLKRV
jgi:hypothetical protein